MVLSSSPAVWREAGIRPAAASGNGEMSQAALPDAPLLTRQTFTTPGGILVLLTTNTGHGLASSLLWIILAEITCSLQLKSEAAQVDTGSKMLHHVHA